MGLNIESIMMRERDETLRGRLWTPVVYHAWRLHEDGKSDFFAAVVIYLISTTYCMSVRRCTAPECQQITVDAKEVRDVYVTDWNINRVTVIGDAARVFIHPLKSSNDHMQGELCGK